MFRRKNQPTGEKKKKSLARRILKWSGISLLLLIVVIIALPFLFKEQIFNKIKEEINKNLNAKFECADYSLTLFTTFPNFTLQLHDVKLSGVEEFEGVDLLKVEDLIFTIDLYSVLWGDQIDIREVGLKKPDIHVLVLENGKANYDISKTDTTAVQPTPEDTAGKFDLQLREYYIENGNITYDDRAGNMSARIVNLNHSGKGDFTQDLFEFKTVTTADTLDFIMDGIPYMKNTKVDFTVNLDMDMPNSKYTFKDNLIKMNELELGFDGWLAMPDTNIDMDINFSAKKTDFKNLFSMVPAIYTADYNAIKFTGKTGFTGSMNGRMNAVSMPAFNLDLSVDNGSFHYPGLPKAATGIFVKANVNTKGTDPNMDDMVVDVPVFKMNFGATVIDAFLNLVNPMTDPGIKAGIIAKADLSKLKEVMPMGEGEEYNGRIDADIKINGRYSTLEKGDYANFQAEGKLIAEDVRYKSPDVPYETVINLMDFKFSPQQLELAAFDAKVNKSEIKANGSMDNYLAYFLVGDPLNGKFNVSSPELNLGDFMSSAETTSAPATEASAPTETSSEMTVFEVPENINFQLTTQIGKITYPNDPGRPDIVLDNVNGGVSLAKSVMSLDNFRFNTLDGSIAMNGSYSTINKTEPDVKFKFDAANIDIKKATTTYNFVETLAPIGSKCTGKISTRMNFNSKLNSKMEPVYETMTGDGVLSTKSVYIEGFEPLNQLAAKLKIPRLSKQTIQDVNISYKFVDGRVYVDPYEIKIANYKSTIAGSTGFDQSLDYKMNMSIPRSDFGPANEALTEMMNRAGKATGSDIKMSDVVNIAVKMTGTITDPKVETDYKEQLTDLKTEIKEEIKEKIEEKVEEVKEDIKAKANEEAQKIIKEAEARAEQIRAEAKKLADKTRAEGKAAGDKVIAEAGTNPLKKIAAEKAADKLNKEAEEKAVKIEKEADEKAQKVIDEAKTKADALK
jgi:hypothetical protein